MAAFIAWKPEFAVGVASIDTQHRHFLGLVNLLRALTPAESAGERGRHVREELRSYVVFHFAHEENLMRDHGFPALEHHCGEHAQLLADLDRRLAAPAGTGREREELVMFLWTWFIDHTTRQDRALAAHLAHG